MSEKDKANLLAIVDSASKILRFTQGYLNADAFYDDEKTFDAVLMNFIVIGESVNRLSSGLIQSKVHVPWVEINGLRNLVAHNYFGVDAEEVWQIIGNDLKPLIHTLEKILEET